MTQMTQNGNVITRQKKHLRGYIFICISYRDQNIFSYRNLKEKKKRKRRKEKEEKKKIKIRKEKKKRKVKK